jgi:hypothetical protein
MRWLPVLLGACLLGGALGTCWFRGDDAAPPPAPLGVSASGPASATDAAAVVGASADERMHGEVGDDGATLVDAGGDEREPVGMPPARGAPRVQVVRGEPPQAVAGAVVFFVRDADIAARASRAPLRLPPTRPELPEAFGHRATTDADGCVALPAGDAPWLCSASHDGGFAFAVVPPRHHTHTLSLLPDEQVTLRALDPDDRPVGGLPLIIAQQFGRDDAGPIWRGTTGADGRAVARHFQLVREQRRNPPQSRYCALPAMPGGLAVEFAGQPATTDEVILRAAPHGDIAVQVVDHQGAPVLARAVVGLFAWTPLGGPEGLRLPPGLVAPRADKPPGPDPVVLPFQPVGDEVRAFARFLLDRRQAESTPTAGPAEGGQRIVVPVPLRPAQALLAGKLLLADGAPFAGAVEAALWQHDRDVLATPIDSLADGRFDVVLAQRVDQAEYWLELRCSPPATAGDAAVGPIGARVRVPRLVGGMRHDLGTIRLVPLPPCVTGLVVDDEGTPVANADVHVQQELPPAPNERARDPWRPLPLFRTRSGDDGRFTIPGQKPPGTLRVRADTDAHFADAVPLHTQGQDVRIRIDRNGILRGRVLLPEFLADGTASLVLRPFDPAARERDTRRIDLARARGGRFVVEPLRPGRFDAVVMVRNLPEPLAVVPDVFVQPGEVRDARLRPLDLRGALHRLRLRAVDAAGQPFPLDGPILARLPRADGAIADAAFRWQRGRAELITGSPTVDLTFFGRGHQTLRMVLGAGDHDVRLPATRPALLELPGLRALCGPNRKVRISVLLQGDTGLPGSFGGVDQRSGERFGFARWDLGRSSGAWLGTSDSVDVPLLQSGKYQVLVRPHATDSERSPQGELALGVHELQVDGSSWLPVRVPVDPVALGGLLQRLDGDFAAAQAAQLRGEVRGSRPGGR